MGSSVVSGPFGTPEQIEVLTCVEPFIVQETAAHRERRRLWFPNDLNAADAYVPADAEAVASEERRLREAARGLPDEVRVSIALNLLTEEGLPHFHRLIATYFGNDSPWSTWNNMWTAEEDRHGCVLRDYVRDARIFHMGELERMQYAYIEAGFNPEWQRDPYRLFAYTSLQERATQMAHAAAARRCAQYEPTIQKIFSNVAGDEARHYQFYRAAFGEFLRLDPNRALQALLKVMPALEMPGHAMPNYEAMAEVVRRAELYGPQDYRRIVVELLEYWQIGTLTNLSAEGRTAQDKLMKIPQRLQRIADHLDARSAPRTFEFSFLPGRQLTL